MSKVTTHSTSCLPDSYILLTEGTAPYHGHWLKVYTASWRLAPQPHSVTSKLLHILAFKRLFHGSIRLAASKWGGVWSDCRSVLWPYAYGWVSIKAMLYSWSDAAWVLEQWRWWRHCEQERHTCQSCSEWITGLPSLEGVWWHRPFSSRDSIQLGAPHPSVLANRTVSSGGSYVGLDERKPMLLGPCIASHSAVKASLWALCSLMGMNTVEILTFWA